MVELEGWLLNYNDVFDVMVVGIFDEVVGERFLVFIILIVDVNKKV